MVQFPYEDLENKSMRFSHITEMTIVTVQLIVEFAKRVPGFETLLQNDQITLLKVSNRLLKYISITKDNKTLILFSFFELPKLV